MLVDFWRRLRARLLGLGRSARPDPLAGLADSDEHGRLRLVVGLGNPGPKYAATRHNVGFRTVARLADRLGGSWVDDAERTASLVAAVRADDLPLVLAQPQTYMNRSGEAVSALLDALALAPDDLLVVYDDMDLPFGSLRLRERGSAGTHNGMRSVVSALATEAFPRLRIGIGQSGRPGAATDHVLGGFSAEEAQPADELIDRAADAALAWASQGAASAMNRFNTRG